MVQRQYLGISNPKEAFEALRPFDDALIKMMTRVKPMGADYMILQAVRTTLGTAAYHFTREHAFYAPTPHGW